MKLSLISIEREMVRLEADGHITSMDFNADGKSPFEQLLGLTWSRNVIALDLNKVPYIDSSAIGWLMASNKTLKEGGGSLVIHSLQPPVKQVLDLLKVGRVLKIAEDEDGARSLLAQGGVK